MDLREKLIELLDEKQHHGNSISIGVNYIQNSEIADHLIASDFFEELQNEAYDLGVDSVLHNKFGLSWEDASGLRKEIKRLQDAARWIPVTDRLPDDGEDVLLYDKVFRFFELGTYYKKGKVLDAYWTISGRNFPIDDYTHWMPLPEPPKGDE